MPNSARFGDRASAAGSSAVHVQRFTVAYEYPVYFTEDVFSPSNLV